MADLDLAVLSAVRDAGLSQPRPDELRGRVASALGREIEAERRDRSRRRRLPGLGALATGLGALLAIGIVVAALATLHRGPSRPLRPASAQGLIAKLAILRQPQTPSDTLPDHLTFVHGLRGTVIPSLTRLAATPPGARLYLVVTTPVTGPGALWSPSLGDQVSIVAVNGDRATQSFPIPAADLDDADEAGPIRAVSGSRLAHTYDAAVIPDGVAHVRWESVDLAGDRLGSLNPRLANNLAYLPIKTSHPLLGTWYAADGGVIPTSRRVLQDALAARQSHQRAQLIRDLSRTSYHVPRALLADFAVFSITSRTGVPVGGGLTISRPSLSSLPYAILSMAGRAPSQHDLRDVRQVTAASGRKMWVFPGGGGICLFVNNPLSPPGRDGSGAGGGCSGSVASAEEEGGMGMSTGGVGPSVRYKVLPRSHPTLTIRTGSHATRTIRPPYGVYIGTATIVYR
jgi:hypothetical protein